MTMLDKMPYQAYTIEHGIERIKIQIPLKNVPSFEQEFSTALTEGVDTKESLLKIVSAHNGSICSKQGTSK